MSDYATYLARGQDGNFAKRRIASLAATANPAVIHAVLDAARQSMECFDLRYVGIQMEEIFGESVLRFDMLKDGEDYVSTICRLNTDGWGLEVDGCERIIPVAPC